MKLTHDHLRFMNLGERYFGATLGDCTPSQKKALEGYLSSIESHLRNGTGLFLWGDNNTGKSYITAALCKYVWGQYRIPSFCILASDLKTAWISDRRIDESFEDTILERVETVRFLVIDDIGKEHRAASGFAENQFGALLRSRARARKTTCITSNMSPKDFGETYGRSTGQLSKECMIPVQLKGDDMRAIIAEGLVEP